MVKKLKLSYFLLTSAVFLSVSCKKETDSRQDEFSVNPMHKSSTIIMPFPEIRGELVHLKNRHTSEEFRLIKKGDLYVAGPNIVLSQNVVNNLTGSNNPWQRGGVKPPADGYERLWPRKTVVYDFEISTPADIIQKALSAMKYWMDVTDIKFRQARGNESDDNGILKIKKSTSCFSFYGYPGPYQNAAFNISDNCSHMDIVKNLGIAIGIFPEHQRKDRDDYIRVNYSNMTSEYNPYFEKLGDPVGGAFDFNSLFMENSYYFASLPNRPTMLKKEDRSIIIPQRNGLSSGDISAYYQLYGPKRNISITKGETEVEEKVMGPSGSHVYTEKLILNYNINFFDNNSIGLPITLKIRKVTEQGSEIKFMHIEEPNYLNYNIMCKGKRVYYMGKLSSEYFETVELLPYYGYEVLN